MKNQKLKIDAVKLGTASGIVGALIIFFTTLTGLYGASQAHTFFTSSVWSSFGYSLSWGGAIIGAILGFIYAFVFVWVTVLIYNKFIS